MLFIFPQNYDFKNKLFGVIDYFTVFINIIYYLFVFCLLNLFFNNLNIKVFLFIVLCFPIFILSIVSSQKESLLTIIIYFIKFIFNRKIYLFNK